MLISIIITCRKRLLRKDVPLMMEMFACQRIKVQT